MTMFSTIFNAISPVSSSMLKPAALGGAIVATVIGFYTWAEHQQHLADIASYQAQIQSTLLNNQKRESQANVTYQQIADKFQQQTKANVELAKTNSELKKQLAAIAEYADDLDASSLRESDNNTDSKPKAPAIATNCSARNTKERSAVSGAMSQLKDCTQTLHSLWLIRQADEKEFAE